MPKQSSTVSISKEQKEILLGILLGDGHMEIAQNGKSARLKIEQSCEKREYVEHLYKVFQNWNPGEIVPATNSNNLKFSTGYSTSLLHYHQEFYRNPDNSIEKKKRHIPKWIEHSFTDRSLAYLYMDDGGIKSEDSKGVFLNVYDLEYKDQAFLSSILEKKFSLNAKVVKDRTYHRIYISGYSYETFVALVGPWILPIFQYKIPPARKANSRFL